jgi:Protein of unknown function (DUF4232)
MRIVSAVGLAALVTAGALYAAGASGRNRVASCSVIRVAGGAFNAATGGQAVADVTVRNVGNSDCTIGGRPWVRLGPLRYPVRVEDATHLVFGSLAGVPEHVLTLRPRQKAYADLLIQPGSCGQARPEVFSPRARAGWGRHGVTIGDLVCKDGTGTVWVGAFQKKGP